MKRAPFENKIRDVFGVKTPFYFTEVDETLGSEALLSSSLELACLASGVATTGLNTWGRDLFPGSKSGAGSQCCTD
jgi:hypothetical protein